MFTKMAGTAYNIQKKVSRVTIMYLSPLISLLFRRAKVMLFGLHIFFYIGEFCSSYRKAIAVKEGELGANA